MGFENGAAETASISKPDRVRKGLGGDTVKWASPVACGACLQNNSVLLSQIHIKLLAW